MSGGRLKNLVTLSLILLSVSLVIVVNGPGILPIDSKISGDDLNSGNFSSTVLPNILIGTSNGDVYLKGHSSDLTHLGSVKDDIQDIEKTGKQVYVATVQDETRAEERGRSNGKVLMFDQSENEEAFLDNIFSGSDGEAKIGGQVLDMEKIGDKLLVATHSHESTSEGDGWAISDGKIIVLNKDLDVNREIELGSASDISVYNETVLGYGVGSKAILLSRDDLSVRNEIEAEGTISDADRHGENIYFSSRREKKMTGVPNPPNISHGYVSKHSETGEELASIDLGTASYPREVKAYGKDSLVVNDYARKEIRFVDFSRDETVGKIELEDRPEHLLISGDRAYATGVEKDLLYVIDLDKRELDGKIHVDGISSISTY